MDKFKEFLRNNKKLLAAILIALLGLAGLKVSQDEADKIVDTGVNLVAPMPTVTPPVVTVPNQ